MSDAVNDAVNDASAEVQVEVEGAAARGSAEALSSMWRAQRNRWHAMFGVIVAIEALCMIWTEDGNARQIALIALAVTTGAYAVASRVSEQFFRERTGMAYLAVAWPMYLVMQAVSTSGLVWILSMALFPQTWAMLERRSAVLVTFAVGLGLFVVGGWSVGWNPGDMTSVLLSSLIALGLSLALGLFIHRIIDEAEGRAEIIDELRATQTRLALVERDRGVTAERERLSREIHDTLAQGFTSALALTRAADAALARGDIESARSRLALLETTAVDNLNEARLIVAELTPGHLESRTLAEALERLVATLRDSGGVDATMTVIGDPVALGGAKEVVLLRAAQEATSNIRRHAAASRVTVTLAYAVGQVALSVADDGAGFDATQTSSGYGLDGLAARAAEVGGTLTLDAAPGAGTRLLVQIPRGEGSFPAPSALCVNPPEFPGEFTHTAQESATEKNATERTARVEGAT